MSKSRWWIVGVVVAVVAATAVWRLAPGDDNADAGLAATLTDVSVDSRDATNRYIYPVWATDGRTPLKLAYEDGQLQLTDPLAARERPPRLDVVLPGSKSMEPDAVAILPGSAQGPWIAVGSPSREIDPEDVTTTERPLVWTGSGLDPSDLPARADDPLELPADLRSNEGDGAYATIDAAVARLAGHEVAVVKTRQLSKDKKLDYGTFSVCRLDETCRWKAAAVPDNTAVDEVGSTGTGLVAVTTGYMDHGAIWFTDDPQLPWMRVGTAPGGTSLTSMQDGVGEVTLVWTARNGDVTVQTVRGSKLRTVVQRTHVQGKEPYHPAVAKVGGHWFLGGARQGPAGMRLPYENDSPTLWELRDKAWVPLDDDLLRNQPAQHIEVLFAGPKGTLRAFSSAAADGIVMGWQFGRTPS